MIKSQLQISRRWFLRGSLASVLLSSCGENRLGRTIIDAYKLTFQDRPSPLLTREYITKLPYASISAKIGKGPKSLLVLWRVENNEQFWLAEDGVVLGIKKGRIIKTAGLPETISDTNSIETDPLILGLNKIENHRTFERTIDFKEKNSTYPKTIKILSNFSYEGSQIVNIVDIDFETILVKETCSAKNLNWKFENFFWVDPETGMVWKSIQHVSRGFEPIIMEVLKPAG